MDLRFYIAIGLSCFGTTATATVLGRDFRAPEKDKIADVHYWSRPDGGSSRETIRCLAAIKTGICAILWYTADCKACV